MAPRANHRSGYSRRAQYSFFAGYVIAIAGGLVGAVLFLLSTLDPPAFAGLRAAAGEVTTPISGGLANIGRGLAAAPDWIGGLFTTRAENERLTRRLKQTEAALARTRQLFRENQRLRDLLKVRDATPGTIIAARLVSSSVSSTRRYALLNAGSWQGVREGQPVIGPEGLIGRVLEIGPNSARVLLASDPESVVPVRRMSDGAAAFVTGRGDGLLDVKPVVLNTLNLVPGDLLVTSGAGGMFAPDIPVARVIRRNADGGGLARPLADPSILDFALVQQAFLPPPVSAPTPKGSR